MPSALNSTQKKGDAGEYAAAAELAIRGWMVDLPRRGARGIDLYGRSPDGHRTCGIQVKAQTRGDFAFGPDLLELAEPTADEWVILVTLAQPGKRCQFYVVPRNHVTAGLLAYKGYSDAEGKAWTRMLFGPTEFSGYLEAWHLMERPALEAPWAMAEWVATALGEHRREARFAARTLTLTSTLKSHAVGTCRGSRPLRREQRPRGFSP